MTLIDKAALLNRIATEVHYDSEHSLEMYAKLLSEINDAPTVEAEPVVRCKDCIHYKGLAECDVIGDCMGTDGYCAWGERRENEKDESSDE